jgi:hypothetical protein
MFSNSKNGSMKKMARSGFSDQKSQLKTTRSKTSLKRARETNHLIAGLQKMLTPLLGRASDVGNPSNSRADDLNRG